MIRDQIGQGLGFSIAGGQGSPPFKDGSDGIYISRITDGGLAHRDGKILVGDKVLVVCANMEAFSTIKSPTVQHYCLQSMQICAPFNIKFLMK